MIAQDMYPVRGDEGGYISPERLSPSIHILGDQTNNVVNVLGRNNDGAGNTDTGISQAYGFLKKSSNLIRIRSLISESFESRDTCVGR